MRSVARVSTVFVLGAVVVGCGGGGGGRGSAAAGATATATPSDITSFNASSVARAGHTATLLPSGDVLVVGGVDAAGEPLSSTVIVSGTTARPGPDLGTGRLGHSATLLPTGEVLIAGGVTGSDVTSVLASTELFDPMTDSIAPGPALAEARAWHVAAVCSGAQGVESVLLAGGVSTAGLTASAELFDTETRTSALLTATLRAPQRDARSAVLDDGRVLVVSGSGEAGPAGADLFDPSTGQFTPVSAVVAREGAGVVALGAEALVVGGESPTGLEASTELFLGATSTFAQRPPVGVARRDAVAVQVGPHVLVVGGWDASGPTSLVEIISVNAVEVGQPLLAARVLHTVTPLDDTHALVIGGQDAEGGLVDQLEVIDLSAATPVAVTPAVPAVTPVAPVMPVGPCQPAMPSTPTVSASLPAECRELPRPRRPRMIIRFVIRCLFDR